MPPALCQIGLNAFPKTEINHSCFAANVKSHAMKITTFYLLKSVEVPSEDSRQMNGHLFYVEILLQMTES